VDSTNATLSAGAAAVPVPDDTQVLIEDGQGNGAYAVVTTPSELQLAPPVPPLSPPLRALYNLLTVSRGQTVSEVLGSGNAAIAGQEFVLQKSPLTYLLNADSKSGDGYSSTLRVWVDGIEWREVPSFYGQSPNARVFVTKEDVQGKTHVLGGDAINGSRFSTGVNNVVARYRYGSGLDAPAAGSLTVILQPQPNLTAVRNPVAVGGGADPDPPSQVRRYAPRSVLTFGRAVSADDYEVIAAQAPGVARARSYWAWDAEEQRTLVTVYVGDDDGARQAAQTALNDADDPNRPIRVRLATAVPISLSLAVLIDPTRDVPTVVKAVRAALLDPDSGLFGIGQSLFESKIFKVCLGVPGTRAVHGLQFLVQQAGAWVPETGYRHDPGEGGFYQLLDDNLGVTGYAQ
jgi:predicted phage baseplate assembly protein